MAPKRVRSDTSSVELPLFLAGDPREDLPLNGAAIAEIRAFALARLSMLGLSEQEAEIAYGSVEFLRSPEFQTLFDAYKQSEAAEVSYNGYVVLYEPSMPPAYSAVTLFEERGFVMGPEAFSTRTETTITIIQEFYRLNTSEIAGSGYAGGAESPNAIETQTTRTFVERAFSALEMHFRQTISC